MGELLGVELGRFVGGSIISSVSNGVGNADGVRVGDDEGL